MHVLFASHSAALGGAELALAELVELLSRGGAEVTVLLPADGPLHARISRHARVRFVDLAWWASLQPHRGPKRLRGLASSLRQVPAIVATLRRLRPDVAVTNTIASPSLAVAASVARVPHLWMLHERGLPEQGLFFDLGRRASFRIAARLSRGLLAASAQLAAETSAMTGRPCERLYGCVPVPAGALPRRATDGPPYRILSLGHITPAKRQAEVVEALGLLRGRGLDVSLTLVGRADPAYADELRRIADDLGVARSLELLSHDPTPGEWFARSHVLVSASCFEVAPRVVVEALKAELPVVAADSGGNSEMLQNGRGALYPPGDVPGLAAAVTAVLECPTASAAGHAWATETFTEDGYVQGFLNMARRFVAEPRRW